MNRIRWYGPSVLLLLAVAATLLLGPTLMKQMAHAQTEARIQLTRAEMASNPFLAQLSQAFRQVADVVEPSVVSVEVRSRQQPGAGDLEDQLRRRFGPGLPEEFFGPQSPFGQQQPPQQNPYEQYDVPQPFGNGSGWVYDEAGHIVTNNHVVANADEVVVRFSDKSEYVAEVVGTDPSTDVAVLKIDADALHPAVRAEEPVEKGDIVFAFGSPFQFEFSMSQGIVSAKGRQNLGIIGRGGYENFIQTDAAINPGNSGGPLTDIYGRVVGMNTAIASRTGAYNGLGFAIPVSMVTDVVEQIITQGQVQRGYLGVYIEDLTPAMAETFGYEGSGVLVADTIEGSPAEDAGLQAGDIIVSVNGEAVDSADALRFRVARLQPGSDVELGVLREGDRETVTVTLGQLPGQQQASRGDSGRGDELDTDAQGAQVLQKLGITAVAPFTRQMAQQIGVPHIPGVLIESVRPRSLAAAAGLTRGSIILRVQGDAVEDVRDLAELMQANAGRTAVRLRVAQWDRQQEQFMERFVALEMPQQ